MTFNISECNHFLHFGHREFVLLQFWKLGTYKGIQF